MYEKHFGFRELPFGLTPDTSFFFACPSYQEALNTLLIATANGEGFIKVTGEVGHGKTLLCRKFLAALDDDAHKTAQRTPKHQPKARVAGYVTAYIPNPYLEPRGLLHALAEEFGVTVPPEADLHQLVKALTSALMDFAQQNKRAVLCLDEAQAMPIVTLEALRLLTNLETEKRKLLQVVLFGQPELDVRLQQDSVRQLLQRITFHYRLKGLPRSELELYLNHRLRVAGYGAGRVFTGRAVRLLHRYTDGTPRLVNILAHKCLMLAYGEGVREVLPRHVRASAADTPAAKQRMSAFARLHTLFGV